MTLQEFSDGMTTMLSSFDTVAQFGDQASKREISLNEHEKSFWLTKAQEELVIDLYAGRNPIGASFESTEELRRYLDTLLKTKTYVVSEQVPGTGISPQSKLYTAPSDLAFIVMEQVVLNDSTLGCYNGTTVEVRPTTHDEYERIKNNPFVGPSKRRALRLESNNGLLEIISKYVIGDYTIRYLSRPTPIVLENLPDGLSIDGVSVATECTLSPLLHKTILENAVRLALSSKAIYAKTE